MHIPDILEDSDSDFDSDSFTIRAQKLTGIGESSQAKGNDVEGSNQQVWAMETRTDVLNFKALYEDSSLPKSGKMKKPAEGINTGISHATNILSPEEFITDDGIIHTQDSVDPEADALEKVVDNQATHNDEDLPSETNGVSDKPEEMQVIVVEDDPMEDSIPNAVIISGGGDQIPQERRSERLKKDTNLHTMDKVTKMAQKRNLEDYSTHTNSFSVLPVEEIISISADMGVTINQDDYDTFDLLNDLEQARGVIYI